MLLAILDIEPHIAAIITAIVTIATPVIGGVTYIVRWLLANVAENQKNLRETQEKHLESITTLVDSAKRKDELLGEQTTSIKQLGEAVKANTDEVRAHREETKRLADDVKEVKTWKDTWQQQIAAAPAVPKRGQHQ